MTTTDYEAKARSMMTPDEIALIGTPCDVCRQPLSAVTVYVRGTTCGLCQDGYGPDRLPASVLTMALVMFPVLTR